MATKLLKDYELNEEVVTDTQIIAALGYTPENTANKKNSLAEDSETYFVSQSAVNDGLALKADANNVLALDNTTPFTPDGDYEPATKKYVESFAIAMAVAL